MSQHRHLPLVAERPFLVAPSPAALGYGSGAAPALPGAEDERSLLQVGDLAKAVGKTVRAIHHYEEVGLLRPHARSKGRYRLYDEEAVTRLRWIQKMHDLGFSLAQIQEVARSWERAETAHGGMGHVRDVYRTKLAETRVQIEKLGALERELRESLVYLESCKPCDADAPAADECGACTRHPEDPPELVAGVHATTRSDA